MFRTRIIGFIGLGLLAVLFLAMWLHQWQIDKSVAYLNSNGVRCSLSRRRDAYVIGGVAIDEAGVLTPHAAASAVMVLSHTSGGVIVYDSDGNERRYVGSESEGQMLFLEKPYSVIQNERDARYRIAGVVGVALLATLLLAVCVRKLCRSGSA